MYCLLWLMAYSSLLICCRFFAALEMGKGKVVAEKVEARMAGVEMTPKVEAEMSEKVAVVKQDADGYTWPRY